MEAFRDCGWAAFVMVFVGILGLAVAGVSVILALVARSAAPPLAAGAVAMLLGVVAIGIGPLAAMRGRMITERAIEGAAVDESQKARIREEGDREASACIPIGGASGALPLLAGVPAIVVGFRRRKKSS